MLLEFLRYFDKKEGRIPRERDFVNNPKYPSFRVYQERFGNWNNAVKLADLGINYADRNPLYTDEELLEYLILFYEENGRPPTERNFLNNPKYPSFKVYQARFRSWNKAIEMVGLLDEKKIVVVYADDELLKYLVLYYEENGRPPAKRDFINNPKYPSSSTYIRRFGSWQKALKLVCLDTDSMIMKGIIKTDDQKARLAEILVREHFSGRVIDLSGDNRNSPCDGICPKGEPYDVKSSKLYHNNRWDFGLDNSSKNKIEWYYLLAFNEDYSKLEYAWRIPAWEFMEYIEKGRLTVYKSQIEDMKQYEIIDRLMPIFKKLVR